MMDVCIKSIDEDVWCKFKAKAAENGMKIGEYFKELVIKSNSSPLKSNVHEILYGAKPLKGILSQKDYKKIREDFRKGFQMRI